MFHNNDITNIVSTRNVPMSLSLKSGKSNNHGTYKDMTNISVTESQKPNTNVAASTCRNGTNKERTTLA